MIIIFEKRSVFCDTHAATRKIKEKVEGKTIHNHALKNKNKTKTILRALNKKNILPESMLRLLLDIRR